MAEGQLVSVASKTDGAEALRVFFAITHVDEITLELCRQALERQTVRPVGLAVVSGVSPASAAFNRCLDLALEAQADVLVHTAADCILDKRSVARMLQRFDLETMYAISATGFDVLSGNDTSIGSWSLNMRVIGDKFRFRDTFKMDLDFCERIEAATGLQRDKPRYKVQLGYHHPIWQPRELYQKFRYNGPKYGMKRIRRFQALLEECLAVNPDNSTLKAGLLGLKRGAAETHDFGGPNRSAFEAEWNEVLELLDVQPGDFFAYHADFVEIGRKLLQSEWAPIPMAEAFFDEGVVRPAVESYVAPTASRYSSPDASAKDFSASRSEKDAKLAARAAKLKAKADKENARAEKERIKAEKALRRERAERIAGSRLAGVVYRTENLARRVVGFGLRRAKNALPDARMLYRSAKRRGLAHAKDIAAPLYARAPEGVKNVYRRLRGVPVVAPAIRIAAASTQPIRKFGADDAGRIEWKTRWDEADRSKRLLLIAPKDFAGSMYKWTEAVNRHTDFAARLVTFERHQYDYPVDLVVPEADDERLRRFLELVQQAGTLHLKDEHSWFMRLPKFKNLRLLDAVFFSDEFKSVPKVFTHYGGYARKFREDPSYIDAVSRFDARIAMTPDLNYEWFDGAYIPHTIDVETIPFTWEDTKVFAHSPSSPQKKATYLFEEAIQLLPRQYPDVWKGWSVDLIHGVSFAECMRRKQQASLFFDQAGRHRVADLGIDDIIGWYGNSAIEAMAFGIPTMAHMSDFAFERALAAGVDLSDTPVINIERNRKSLMDAFLKFATLEPEGRADVARRTRAFTESFHGYQACGVRLAEIYASLACSRTTSQPLLRNAS